MKTSVNPLVAARLVRDQIAAPDPSMAVFNPETMRQHVDKSLLLPRISALLLVIFGAVGLTLAAIGLYGVMSYSVRRRTRDMRTRVYSYGAQARAESLSERLEMETPKYSAFTQRFAPIRRG